MLLDLKKTTSQYAKMGLLRKQRAITDKKNNEIVIDNKKVINFTSNDYLNISQHASVKKAFIQGIKKYGMGSGASPLVSGYYHSHKALEEAFCQFLQRDRALLFNSGYHANLAIINALAKIYPNVIADELCHASMIDGMLLSRKSIKRYTHNCHHEVKKLLAAKPKSLLVTESVFSILGDLAPIDTIAKHSLEHESCLVVDDAHGIGVLGENGKGICELFNLTQEEVPCLSIPLGKAFGGFGAIVSGHNDLIEYLLQFARTYCYSTALPPALCVAMLASLEVIRLQAWRRKKLKTTIHLFVELAKDKKLPLISYDLTPIKSILTSSNKLTLRVQKKLLDKGFFVSCIRPPTVPKEQACIRISLNCMHSEGQITELVEILSDEKLYVEK